MTFLVESSSTGTLRTLDGRVRAGPRPSAATCTTGHPPPGAECVCGWRVYAGPGRHPDPGAVLGLVELSGPLLPAADDGRVACIRPLALVVGAGVGSEDEVSIAVDHDVPVYRSALPVGVLASYLEERPALALALHDAPERTHDLLAPYATEWEQRWMLERGDRDVPVREPEGTPHETRERSPWRAAALALAGLCAVPAALTSSFAWWTQDWSLATVGARLAFGVPALLVVALVSASIVAALVGPVTTLRAGRRPGPAELLLAWSAVAIGVLCHRAVSHGPDPATPLLPVAAAAVALVLVRLLVVGLREPGHRVE